MSLDRAGPAVRDVGQAGDGRVHGRRLLGVLALFLLDLYAKLQQGRGRSGTQRRGYGSTPHPGTARGAIVVSVHAAPGTATDHARHARLRTARIRGCRFPAGRWPVP